jgi:YegS/Rv2252/BmrU family lipid kinase
MATEPLPKQAVVVVNVQSRRGEEAFEQACEKLGEAGIHVIARHPVTDPDDMRKIVREAIEQGAPMIIVGGGDGSLSTTIDDFIATDTVFAFLPLGTANSFAKTLGVPVDLDGAIDVIANGVRRRIDLGFIDKDYFANAAAIGMSPLIAETVPHKLKKYLGMFGYVLWAIRVAFRFRPFRLYVDDGKTVTRIWATEARIANGSHHGGIELVESASVDSGEIVVQAVTGRSLFGLAWSWFSTLFKLRSRALTVREFHGRKLHIRTKPPQRISIDGELAAETPVTVGVARGAVVVAAPREDEKAAA